MYVGAGMITMIFLDGVLMSNNNSARGRLAKDAPVIIEDKDTGLITFHKWVRDYYVPTCLYSTFCLHSFTNKEFKRRMKTISSKELLHFFCGEEILRKYLEMHRVGKEIVVALATGTKVRVLWVCAFCILL